ncbi:MAG TPA: alpha/beta hydrolase [Candidatus Bathyarchaeia archaeon]|nr:alpha/beta hydrolase [Candidatus Bathyarchaeia archaeon]
MATKNFVKSFEVDGIKLGFVEGGSGQSIIFVHGIPTDYRAWNAQVEAFSNNFHAVSYSRRCAYPYDRKDFENSTIENNAKDLTGLIAHFDLDRFHLVGHSYGGFIAAYYALQHPSSLRSLVLVNPYIPTLLVKSLNSTKDRLALLVKMPSVALSAQKLLGSSVYPALKELDRGNGEKALRIHIAGLQQNQNAFDQLPEQAKRMMLDNKETIRELTAKLPAFTTKEAKTISTPTLLVKGQVCPKALCTMVDLLSRSMPNSKVTTINSSAHFPHFENPAEFNSEINLFLSKQIN